MIQDVVYVATVAHSKSRIIARAVSKQTDILFMVNALLQFAVKAMGLYIAENAH